jgi:hypothetical protein
MYIYIFISIIITKGIESQPISSSSIHVAEILAGARAKQTERLLPITNCEAASGPASVFDGG